MSCGYFETCFYTKINKKKNEGTPPWDMNTKVWTNKAGKKIRPVEMDDAYLQNTINYLTEGYYNLDWRPAWVVCALSCMEAEMRRRRQSTFSYAFSMAGSEAEKMALVSSALNKALRAVSLGASACGSYYTPTEMFAYAVFLYKRRHNPSVLVKFDSVLGLTITTTDTQGDTTISSQYTFNAVDSAARLLILAGYEK